jgi:hypothetical protein
VKRLCRWLMRLDSEHKPRLFQCPVAPDVN